MPFYEIAGLRVEMPNCHGKTRLQAAPYLSADQQTAADMRILITPERLAETQKAHPEFTGDLEYMLSGSDFYHKLIGKKGVLLHASCVVADGVAYAFSADSGVGKSTHTKLWLEMLGESAYMLNDDKPAIRIIDGEVYACGTPWSGKHNKSTPAIVPLGAICFLQRGTENRIQKAETATALFQFFSQTVRGVGPKATQLQLDTIETIFKKVPVYRLICTQDKSAAELAYKTIKRNV